MTRYKILTAAIGFAALLAGHEAQAQFSGQPAPLANAFTEKQARAACRLEVPNDRRETRRSLAKKRELCIQNKMNGTNR